MKIFKKYRKIIYLLLGSYGGILGRKLTSHFLQKYKTLKEEIRHGVISNNLDLIQIPTLLKIYYFLNFI